MKIIFAMITLLTASAFAGETGYDMANSQSACVLQIMKEAPASLVEACGSETLVNQGLQPFSTMPQAEVLKSALKQAFLAKLTHTEGVVCREYDSSMAYIITCVRQ